MVALLRPIVCIPSCTSTLAPSKSPPFAGLTASLVAPLGPSWQCHETVAAWVRHTCLHTDTHDRKWVVGEQMITSNTPEKCQNPDISILPCILTNHWDHVFFWHVQAHISLGRQQYGGFSQNWHSFLCKLILLMGSGAVTLTLWLRREDHIGITQSSWCRVQCDTEDYESQNLQASVLMCSK